MFKITLKSQNIVSKSMNIYYKKYKMWIKCHIKTIKPLFSK
jgi:hypothetical protein